MIDEELRPDDIQQTTPNTPPPEREMFPPEVKSAIENFEEIKQALIGDDPEWLIPSVDPRALASEP